MSKPKNMTPEQEAAWRERRRAEGRRYIAKLRSTDEGRAHANALRRASHHRRQADEEYRRAAYERVRKTLANNPDYAERKRIAEKERKRAKREAKRIDDHFEAFLAQIEEEERLGQPSGGIV